MAREINRLTVKGVEALQEPGLHADGQGLYLRIDQTLNRRWVFVYFWRGRRREMGLGSESKVSLKSARAAAADARALLASSPPIDPINARRSQTAPIMTFGDLAERVISDMESGWRNPKAGPQWRSSLKTHAAPLWKMAVADVDTEAVLDVLKPIWQRIPETATRVRARIERVLDVAKIENMRTGENPARWKGHIQLLLARQSRTRGHHAALPYEDVPEFIQRLAERPATAARALEFAILAAARTGEVLGARWPEISGDVWIIPAERTKTAKEHRVPVTPRMREILDDIWKLRAADDGYIFPGDQRIEPLSNMAMLMLLQRMDVDCTVHGFRSSFRDWAGDCTDYARETVEEALAHVVGGAVERAYRRRDALAKRRLLMEAWATYCTTPPAANVIRFPKGA